MPFNFTKITEIPIGPISIQVWGLMVAIGMLMGLLVAIREAKRKGIAKDAMIDVFVWIVVLSMIGGRLMYVALFWDDFASDPLRIFKVWEGGMVFYGGIFAAVLTIWVYTHWKKIPFWRLTDCMAPGFAIGIFFGRMGCYLIGDHIGAPIQNCPICFGGSVLPDDSRVRHEVSLYELLAGLVIFIILWSIRKRKRFETNGQLTMVFFALYSFVRFWIDFLRATDQPGNLSDPRFYGLTISQYFSIAIFIFALGALKYPHLLSRKKKH